MRVVWTPEMQMQLRLNSYEQIRIRRESGWSEQQIRASYASHVLFALDEIERLQARVRELEDA